MKKILLIAALSISFPAMANNIATVNGHPITAEEFNYTLKSLRIENASEEQRKAVLNEIINRDLLAQEASKQGVEKTEEVKINLKNARKEILISALLKSWGEKNTISNKEIQTAYDDTIKNAPTKKEYKIRHILVKEEKQAQDLLANINAKKISFSDAAKKESIDTGTKEKGGELDWAPSNVFLPEFAKAVETMEKGVVSGPFKTQYGYHLIEVEDQRDVPTPSLEQATPELRRLLTQKKLIEYVNTLRDKANINIPDVK